MIKVILADDHDIMLDGYTEILQSEEDIEVIGVAHNGKEVLTILELEHCDLILLDLNMPKMDGLEVARILKRDKPQIKIIVLSMLNNIAYIQEAQELGVEGYLLKNCRKTELVDAIRLVAEGGKYVDDTVTDIITRGYKSTFQVNDHDVFLSEREIEIIRMIAMGLTTKQIGIELFISHHTVQTHRKNINFKLNVHSPAELVSFAKDNGIMPFNS